LEFAKEKLVIALDDLDRDQAFDVIEKTKYFAHTYKIGLSLFSAYGPSIVNDIKSLGLDVFLDLKFHDIPMQVEKAIEKVLALAPRFLTIHSLGGKEMLVRAKKMVNGSKTTLLAVSVLTSISQEEFNTMGFFSNIEDGVLRLSELAFSCGINGFVSSAHEANRLKSYFGMGCLVICPGVRQSEINNDDQSRAMSAKKAILAGADALVIGRPITKAKNITEAARAFNQEIKDALRIK
jgi:orotidine-5'-phosphate decarboxylase